MYGSGKEFFARAGLAQKQHRRLARRDLPYPAKSFTKLRIPANQFLQSKLGRQTADDFAEFFKNMATGFPRLHTYPGNVEKLKEAAPDAAP
jgi:hypothetical protein